MTKYIFPEPIMIKAHIHSLRAEYDYATLIEHNDNGYIVSYNNLKCTARWSESNNAYYVDDINGIIAE